MKNRLKARLAGIACMTGGLTFSLYFIALHSLLKAFSLPIEAGAIPARRLGSFLAAARLRYLVNRA